VFNIVEGSQVSIDKIVFRCNKGLNES